MLLEVIHENRNSGRLSLPCLSVVAEGFAECESVPTSSRPVLSLMAGKGCNIREHNCMQAAQEYNAKVMEFAVANTTSTFEYFRKLAETKSTPELVELATSHARSQFETITEQAKELQAICQKAMPTLPQK